MRKAITENGQAILTDEYSFTVYWDEGYWWIESSRNGNVLDDIKAGSNYSDLGFEIGKLVEKHDRFRFDD